MPKQKIIILIIFILSLIALLIWGSLIIKDRYANNNTNNESINTTTTDIKSSNENSSDSDQSENVEPATTENTDNTEDFEPVPEKNSFIKIERGDCLDGCKRFTEDSELAYCQQSCGLATPQDTTKDCINKADLDKDYCFKDLGVEKRDFKICEKISDKGIKKTCIARITEDLLREQMQNFQQLPE